MQCILLSCFHSIFMAFIKLVTTLTKIPHVKFSCAVVTAFFFLYCFNFRNPNTQKSFVFKGTLVYLVTNLEFSSELGLCSYKSSNYTPND